MRTHETADQSVTIASTPHLRLGKWTIRWIAIVMATLTTLTGWKVATRVPYIETDSYQYQAMADGKTVMKPFAFRVLEPATARLFADTTGHTTTDGFRILNLLSGWVLLYGVLSLVLQRPHGIWLALILILMPFWLRNFINYFLPDLPHAALCMVYLILLQRRLWVWASAVLVLMFLTRESTLLLALIAVAVLWRLVGRRIALMQTGAALVGMAASKFAARHAFANQHNIDDTLYLIGKIPWNMSKNIFGVTLWTNTMSIFPPVRLWSVPHWLHMGGIHQVGYSAFNSIYLIHTPVWLLTSFGLGCCVVACLLLKTPLRTLLPREEPYLCIAAIYGVTTFLMTPMLGAALERLFDYGWPLFLVYLPAVMLRAWRNLQPWAVWVLLGLNLVAGWTEVLRVTVFHFSMTGTLWILVGCNIIAAWLLLRRNDAPVNTRAST